MKREHFSSLFNAYGKAEQTAINEPPNSLNQAAFDESAANQSPYVDDDNDLSCGSVPQDTQGVVFRDAFDRKLAIFARSLPVSLDELQTWFEQDRGSINQNQYSDEAIKLAVESFVFDHLQRQPEIDLHPSTWGMCRCIGCYHWTGTWCRNSEISGLSGKVGNPKRWRRCKGFEGKNQ